MFGNCTASPGTYYEVFLTCKLPTLRRDLIADDLPGAFVNRRKRASARAIPAANSMAASRYCGSTRAINPRNPKTVTIAIQRLAIESLIPVGPRPTRPVDMAANARIFTALAPQLTLVSSVGRQVNQNTTNKSADKRTRHCFKCNDSLQHYDLEVTVAFLRSWENVFAQLSGGGSPKSERWVWGLCGHHTFERRREL